MSHEIRTPLNGILGMAQLLQSPTMSDAERLDYARVIMESGETLLVLLNDILDLSKVEAGRMLLQRQSFLPGMLVKDSLRLYAENAASRGLTLRGQWPEGEPPACLGDPVRVRQMLSNLIHNALKFTERGGVEVIASFRQAGNQVRLHIEVCDTGIGIPSEAQARLFTPFTQVDTSSTRAYGGSGLGLSIVSRLAHLMDGEVGIETILVSSRGVTYQVPLTYRGEPLGEAQDSLIGTIEHSVLGTRYVYDAVGDPVFVIELMRVIHEGDTEAELSRGTKSMTVVGSGIVPVSNAAGEMMRVVRVLDGQHVPGSRVPLGTLVGTWTDADGHRQEQVLAVLR
ncbi:Sensor histidine kinase RcsC [bioreactor metagenome]|uniref:histidine kinase n=1 Tax=bioreactor metagenome TaxID=1076179 RepID=A0A645DC00_9ZZZZ